MWIGILITAVVWFYVMYKDPFNIVGIVNSLLTDNTGSYELVPWFQNS